MRSALSVLLVFSMCSLASATHLTWNTDFDTIDSNLFSIGASLEMATFSGDAMSAFGGIFELYKSGSRAWMVDPSGTGTIQFETNAAEVDFYARTRSLASGDTVITAYDDSNAVTGSPITISTPSTGFSYVSFSGDIDHIDVVNMDASYMNSVDDFGFTVVPEPSSLLLGVLAAGAMFFVRRAGKRTAGS